MFLLAVAAAAGIPDVILADPAFADRPLSWVLQGIATRWGPAPDDAATAAFAGLDPAGPSPWRNDPPATPEQDARLDDLAMRWHAAAATVMGRDELDLSTVIRRPGHIGYTPGWIEIRFGLDQVDIEIRRAGLDVDPGWVPWLAVVVRYRYA